MNIKNICCILIPYFNAGPALIDTLNSLESKTYDFDVVIVDDGSDKVKASEILNAYKNKFPIYLLELEDNKGIEHALNFGIKHIKSDYSYIMRMDCGDFCINDRIDKQIAYLEKNKDIYMIGSWVGFVDMRNNFLYTLHHPSDHFKIKKNMHINCAFTHPSVVFRSEIFNETGYYPTGYCAAEDFALFFKIVKKYKTANIPECLVLCRVDPRGISSSKRIMQIKSRIKIQKENFNYSFYAFYGLIRSYMLLNTPRGFSTLLNKIKNKMIVKLKN